LIFSPGESWAFLISYRFFVGVLECTTFFENLLFCIILKHYCNTSILEKHRISPATVSCLKDMQHIFYILIRK
jgi:hypothetical protein